MLGALTPQTIREANAEITAVALIDVTSKRKFCFILDKKKEITSFKEDTKEIISCSSETELLTKFLKTWQELDPTICVHYNGDFFDIPYLYYRIKRILGENKALRLSPIEKVTENLYSADSPVRIGGINCLDFMHLLKKYIAKEESSYKLGDIGTKYVKLGKIEYNGSLDKLFKEDKNKFIEYNLRDVEIIEALEEKLKFIQLTVLISHLCHTPYESIYYNTVLNEGAILTYLKRKGVIAPNKPTTTNPSIKEFNIGDIVVNQRGTPTIEGIIHYINKDQIQVKNSSGAIITRSSNTLKKKDSYAGGYLLDPVPGLYSNLSDLDFTSLYPSIIKSLNLGVETLIGRIVTKDNYEQNFSLEKLKLKNPEEEIIIEKLNNKTYQLKSAKIKLGQLINLIEDNDWSISASGAFYTNEIKSIACEVLEDWFDKREHYRALKKKAGKVEDWEKYKLYDLYQMAFKILQNALYGTYAINGWRFTDGYKICSASITNSGQRLVQTSIDDINHLINNYLEMDVNKLKIIFDL
jgi:DNA polymerase elongation subunit (family B)